MTAAANAAANAAAAPDPTALIARVEAEVPTRALTALVARALGWTTGPSRSGWKLVQPTGYVGGMVIPPQTDTAPAEVWFDPDGRERGGLAGPTEELPPYLDSLDTALGAVPAPRRAALLRGALDRHAHWQAEAGRNDSALVRLPGFVIGALLRERLQAPPEGANGGVDGGTGAVERR